MAAETTKASSGSPRGPVATKRLGLLVFGILFAGLFLVIGVVEGIGDPTIPEGDVAVVEDVQDGSVSEADLKRAMVQQAAGGGLKKIPARGSTKYGELKEKAMEELLNEVWLRGEGEELGIKVTPKQIRSELKTIKAQNFKTAAAFKEFLKTSHFTKQDVIERVRLQVLGTQIQEQIDKEAPQPSSAEVSDYYEEEKGTQYTTKPTRDVRVVITEKKGDATKAKAILVKDNSSGSWKKVAAKYSTDPTSKAKGGLLEGLSDETLQEPLKAAVFQSPKGEVIGPIKYQKNFLVLQVDKLNPEKVQKLAEVSAQIKSQLTQTRAQSTFSEFLRDYEAKWRSRTFCAAGFLTPRCSNYVGSGHPSTASPACYEAHPKAPAKECPAPVEQAKPALPGSVSILKPQGEPLAQRPRPQGAEAPAAVPAAGAPEVAPG